VIGSFTAQKNHLRAVEIMSILGPKYHLTIFGTGPLEQRILDAARDLGVDNIELPGVSSTLPNALARFDLMIQTSDWEGMPLSLIEGHAAGLPIVATNVGDTAAIVADSLTGYLVPRDAPAVLMAEKVRQATKEATYTALSQAARTRSLQFDIMNTAKNYANLYHHAFADAQ